MSTKDERAASESVPSPTDDAAFLADIDRRFRAPLVHYFRKRARSAADVDDLVQEVFLRLARRAGLDDIESIEGYVFHTASNVLRDLARRRAARSETAHLPLDDLSDPGSEISPERVLIGKEALSRLAEALRNLPERTRDVFVLRALEGRKYAEIAKLLGITDRAVEKQMAKALAALGRAMDVGQ